MKHILPLLLLVVSLQACGQSDLTGTATFGAVTKVNGTSIPDNSCDPKTDVDKARDRAIGLTMINGGYDHAIRYCDPKSRQWTVDTEAMKAADAEAVKAEAERVKRVAHNKALIFAMNSRVVTDKEMAEVTELGTGIFSECCAVITGGGFSGSSESWQMQQYASSYYEEKRFNDLLLQQFKLRAIAAEHRPTLRLSDRCAKFYAEDPTSLVGCNSGDPPHSGIQPIMPQMDYGGPAVPPIQTVCKSLPEGGTTCTQTGLPADALNRCGIDIGAVGCIRVAP